MLDLRRRRVAPSPAGGVPIAKSHLIGAVVLSTLVATALTMSPLGIVAALAWLAPVRVHGWGIMDDPPDPTVHPAFRWWLDAHLASFAAVMIHPAFFIYTVGAFVLSAVLTRENDDLQ